MFGGDSTQGLHEFFDFAFVQPFFQGSETEFLRRRIMGMEQRPVGMVEIGDLDGFREILICQIPYPNCYVGNGDPDGGPLPTSAPGFGLMRYPNSSAVSTAPT